MMSQNECNEKNFSKEEVSSILKVSLMTFNSSL